MQHLFLWHVHFCLFHILSFMIHLAWYYCFNSTNVIFVLEVLYTRHIVHVQLEVTGIGVNSRIVQKQTTTKYSEAKSPLAGATGIRSQLL